MLSPSPPASPIRPLGYRAAMIWLRAEATSTSHSLPLPPPIILSHTRPDAPSSGTPPLHLLSTDRREDRPEVTLPPRKRLGIALGPRYEIGESLSATTARPTGGLRADYDFVATMDREIRRDLERDVGYGITDSWDEIVEAMQGTLVVTDVAEFSQRMTEFETRVRRDTDEVYTRLDDEQTGDLARAEVMSLRTTVLAQQAEIRELQSADRRRQTATTEMLAVDHKRQAMINQGVTAALAARDANTNGVDSHNSGISARRNERATRKTIGNDIAYAMTWTELKKKMTDKMFPEESDKIEKYVGGLPDMIHGSVVASKPKTMQEATEMAIEVMDKRIRTFADRQTENKRKQDNNQQPQQQHQNKRQNTGRAYAAGTVEKKQYGGSKPLCSKCNYHHDGPCAPKCHKCNKVGHFARDCRSTANANNANNQKGTGSGQKPTCYECGVQGHFKRECPKLKNNNNRGNQVGGGNAPAKVYAVGHAGTNPDSNVMTGTFLLNNRYASVLFDTGADRSFVSTAFSSQIAITPTALDHYYDVKLADGRIIGLNTILRGCTLNLLNQPFNINLMPVELGSFDAIIGMDWLVKYQAIIVCAEKIVRIP
ncbi:reverse transcriptase domain-containing protein [Tanacetum coccineum]